MGVQLTEVFFFFLNIVCKKGNFLLYKFPFIQFLFISFFFLGGREGMFVVLPLKEVFKRSNKKLSKVAGKQGDIPF